MKNPYKGKAFYYRLTSLVLAIILVGIFGAFFVSDIVKRGYELESNQKIDLYSDFIESRLTAYDRVDAFIEKAVDTELRVMASYLLSEKAQFTDAYLASKVSEFEVSSIAWVNPQGETTAASDPIFYEYKIDENHVLWDFFSGEETILIESIRESFIYQGKPFKFGNFKDEQGNMLQIAIEVADYNAIFAELTLQAIIEDIYTSSEILYAKIINQDYEIIAHSSTILIGMTETETHLIEAIDQKRKITHTHAHELEGIHAYSIAKPIYLGDTFIGILDIGFDPEFVLPIIRTVNVTTFIIITILTLIILAISIYGGKVRSMMFETAFLDQNTRLYSKQALDYTLTQTPTKLRLQHMSYILMNVDNYRTLVGVHGVDRLKEVINVVANRLVSVYDSQYIFKVSIDEFLILCQSQDHEYILKRLKETLELLNSDIVIHDYSFNISFTTAIIDRSDQMAYAELFKNLQRVMREAKRSYKGSYLFYDARLIQRIERNQTIENALKRVLSESTSHELYPVFQPQIDTSTSRLYGFEVLSRLQIDVYGHIAPPEFIKIAEDSGLIQKLGLFILKQTAHFYHTIVELGLKPFPVSINVSMIEIMQKDFSEQFIAHVDGLNVPHEYIQIEITETVLATNFTLLQHQLNTLRNAGIKVSIDDFGMGYSSLIYLKVAPIDFIKLDKTFIDDLNQPEGQHTLSEVVIQVAHQLGAKVIAEGVETELQINRLNMMACDYIQGYYYSKPLKLMDCIEYIKQNTSKY